MNTKLPNFLIVGAAKSGTTSLYYYLKEHPQIFMPKKKEPKFLTSLFLKSHFNGIGDKPVEKSTIKNFEDYKRLFNLVSNEYAIGEASADYLFYYDNVIPNIKKYLGSPKIIIILRNPIERAYSAYMHLLRDKREFLSFEEALKLENKRKKEQWEFIWYYKEVGLYYNQVKAYLDNFNNVRIYLYDNLKEDRLALLQDIYDFLEVDKNYIPNTLNNKYNISKIPRYKALDNFIQNESSLKKVIRPIVKMILPNSKAREQIIKSIKESNLYRPDMKKETREYLRHYYKEDLEKLQYLINKDLSYWLS